MPEVLKRVGRFDLLEVIGRGGAAVVYLAVQRDLQRHVALKELSPVHLADSTFAERFVEESRLAGAMNHANVVTVHEYFEDGSVPYIAMEYLPHGSLRQYIGHLSVAQIAGVLEGVLAGLAHGEAHGIVHRDLKPENLLVATDGRVKIADFGVARAYSKAATRAVVTVAGTTIGTPAYMSPEQALGGDLTPATDLYSLGVVAWELLTGQVPFEENDTPVAVLYRHVHEPIPPARSVNPQIDEGISLWLERMLAKAPEDRFQSADAAWVELEDVVLELLGPRWRREARLVVGGDTATRGHTLTPAAFQTAAAETPAEIPVGPDTPAPASERPAPSGGRPAPVSESPAAATPLHEPQASAPATLAPRRRRPRSNTTMFHIARRHRDLGDDAGPVTPDTLRRRLVVAAIVVAMVAAAVAGVLIADAGRHHGPTAAQRRAAVAAAAAARQARARAALVASTDKKLATIAGKLAKSRNQQLTRLLNARLPKDQATDATSVERAYVSAAGQVAPLEGKSPSAAPLSSTLKTLAADYGTIAAAARADSSRRWSRGWKAITRDETRLRSQVAKL